MKPDLNSYQDYATVGRLLKFIKENNIPDDAHILIQRVEDVYFNKHGWKPIKKEGYFYNDQVKINEKVDNGGFNDKEQYPRLTPENIEALKMTGDDLDSLKEEYVVCWSPVKYREDNNLYLDAHY